MSNPWSQAYEELRKPYLEGKMAKKDYDGDGKVESGAKEYRGVIHNKIQQKMGKKGDGKDTSSVKEHHQKDADGNVIPHGDGTPSSVEEEQINELSKKTLGGYIKKASKETRGNMVATQHGSGIPKRAKDIKLKQVNKRLKGMEKAGEKMAKEDITLTKGDYGSRNIPTSAYGTAKKLGFNKKIYKAGGGLGANFMPLANSYEPAKVAKPNHSNWREDFVWDDNVDEAAKGKKLDVKENGVKNKIEINPDDGLKEEKKN